MQNSVLLHSILIRQFQKIAEVSKIMQKSVQLGPILACCVRVA